MERVTKRKATKQDSDSEQELQGSDLETIDIDFEFFNPSSIDYHSIKLLLSQLLSHDAPALDLGTIADLVIAQGEQFGSTVKTDGKDGDPYAVLSILDLNLHKDNAAVSALVAYLVKKATGNSELHSSLTAVLEGKTTSLGLVLSERLVNMPMQIVGPMYTMLQDELAKSKSTKFTHFLFVSRVFIASSSDLAAESDPNAFLSAAHDSMDTEMATGGESGKKNKKKKKSGRGAGGGSLGQPMVMEPEVRPSGDKDKEEVWLYHPEDELIATVATVKHVFPYSGSPTANAEGRQKDSFGVETRGQMMLLDWSKFAGFVAGLEAFFAG